MRLGVVSLVGAGPGDPGLVTVKGLRRLQEAEVVVYDRLVPTSLLTQTRPDAERIFAGERPRGRGRDQTRINALLIDKAREGKRVVRLKGGDPFVFGRGSEEASALVEAGIPWEVVPGVTSPVAVLAYAGIPVTDRRFSSSFAVVTAREGTRSGEAKPSWLSLVGRVDTLIILMATAALPEITADLLAAGLDPTTPSALVQKGTTSKHRSILAPLADIGERAQQNLVQPPSILVVGEVTSLADSLSWYEGLPLFGLRIGVSSGQGSCSRLTDHLADLGAEVMEIPLFSIADPGDWGPLDRALQAIECFSWLFFPTPLSVERTLTRLCQLGQDTRSLARVRLGAIGPDTATALMDYALRPDLTLDPWEDPEKLGLLQGPGIGSGRVLFPCGGRDGQEIAAELTKLGMQLDCVSCYREVAPDAHVETIRQSIADGLDLVCYTSSSAIWRLVEGLGPSSPLLRAIPCLAVGKATVDAARNAGLEMVAAVPEESEESVVQAILRWRASREKDNQPRGEPPEVSATGG